MRGLRGGRGSRVQGPGPVGEGVRGLRDVQGLGFRFMMWGSLGSRMWGSLGSRMWGSLGSRMLGCLGSRM